MKKVKRTKVTIHKPKALVPIKERVIKQDLIDYVAKRNGITEHLARNMVEMVFESTRDILLFGHPLVKITISGFGVFSMRRLRWSKRGGHLTHQCNLPGVDTRKLHFTEARSLHQFTRIDLDEALDRTVEGNLW